MKINHTRYAIPDKLKKIEFPAVLWWCESNKMGNTTQFHTVDCLEDVVETISNIQSRKGFLRWLGWETLQSYYEHGGMLP